MRSSIKLLGPLVKFYSIPYHLLRIIFINALLALPFTRRPIGEIPFAEFFHAPDMFSLLFTDKASYGWISIWGYSYLLDISASDALLTPITVKNWLIQKFFFYSLLNLLAVHIFKFERLYLLFALGARACTITRPLLDTVVVILMAAAVEAHLLQGADVIKTNRAGLRRQLSHRISIFLYFLDHWRSGTFARGRLNFGLFLRGRWWASSARFVDFQTASHCAWWHRLNLALSFSGVVSLWQLN